MWDNALPRLKRVPALPDKNINVGKLAKVWLLSKNSAVLLGWAGVVCIYIYRSSLIFTGRQHSFSRTNRKFHNLSPFDCHQNQRPRMTLNGRTTLYCTNDASLCYNRWIKDCEMIGMVSCLWTNFGAPCAKSIKISSENPNCITHIHIKNDKCFVHINAYNSCPALENRAFFVDSRSRLSLGVCAHVAGWSIVILRASVLQFGVNNFTILVLRVRRSDIVVAVFACRPRAWYGDDLSVEHFRCWWFCAVVWTIVLLLLLMLLLL